ncbi:ATP-binding domain-containing protein [Candidatus Uhrbacteria bacterium]|nr:ATP-binding domain-containing protein [Candidatus Uhrbacteria bacterium]
MLVDEFQNYLPEQIRLMKTCGQKTAQSMIYIGDIAQQVQIGTVRDWSQIQETISSKRLVELTKVYRNTKEILSFIASLGYTVEIPAELRSGVPVQEVSLSDKTHEINYIQERVHTLEANQTVGVLARNETYLSEFKLAFAQNENVHVLDIKEAQGVEFDVVCLVGVENNLFRDPEGTPEKQRILKNLLYIALTRAMSELHVLGRTKLHRFE